MMRSLLQWSLLLLLLFPTAALAQADSDGDGVEDVLDLCPAEDASFFDADGDGCVDATAHLRHVEYWDAADLPLVWTLHESGAPLIDDGSDQAAIEAGFAAWTSLPDVALTATYAGTTTQAGGDGLDGIHLVSFVDPEFEAIFGSTVLAVGVTTSFTVPTEFGGRNVRPGQIVDADMLFNPARFWSTDTAGSGGVDLQSVATHEAGHLFGMNHSCVVTATMFPALPPGLNARTLENDDRVLAFMSYPDAAALASAAGLEGSVLDGAGLTPIPGAAVFAISAASGDTTAVQFTGLDGSYRFLGLPADDYIVFVQPLDGSNGSNGVVPGFINEIIQTNAITLFVPEFYDAAESAGDDSEASTPVTVAAGSVVAGIDVITNIDSSAPSITNFAPESEQPDVLASTVFLLRFDEAIRFDTVPSRLSLDRIDGAVRTGVGGVVNGLEDGKVLVFTPSGLLDFGARYELTLDAGVEDIFGNATTSPFVSGFTVEARPPLSVRSIDPEFLLPGTVVVLAGESFDTAAASNNQIDFGGVSVPALDASFSQLVVQVPEGIPLGEFPVVVTTPTETSASLTVEGVTSVDIARGSIDKSVSLSGTPRGIAALPDGRWSFVATSAGVDAVVVQGEAAEFGSTRSTALAGGSRAVTITPDGSRLYAVSRSTRKLHVLDADDGGDVSAPLASFLDPLFELEVGAEPLGLTIDPTGTRAYVPTAAGVVQAWDLVPTSPTFHRIVAEYEFEGRGLQGSVALTRNGDRLLALDDNTGLSIFDLVGASAATSVEVGPGARDVVVGPEGNLAYVSREDGMVQVVLLATETMSQTIDTESGGRGAAISPAGTLGFVADRRDDELAIFSLDPDAIGFRTLAASVNVGADPVDVAFSPDGLRVYVAEEGLSQMTIVGIAFGPRLRSFSPRFVSPGDIVSFNGDGFVSRDSTQVEFTSNFYVEFDEERLLVPELGSTFSTGWARIPASYQSGPITVLNDGPVAVGVPNPASSNPVFAGVFEAEDIARSFNLVERAVSLGDNVGLDWDFGTGIEAGVDVSPNGDFVLIEAISGYLQVIDTRPESPTYLRGIGQIPLDDIGPDRVITPDGTRLYTRVGNAVNYFDVELGSSSFGTQLGSIDFDAYDLSITPFGGLGQIAVSPDGYHLVVETNLFEGILLAEIAGPTANQVIGDLSTNNSGFDRAAFHSSGRWAYLINNGPMDVISLDPYGSFLSNGSTVFSEEMQDLAASPDGRLLFALARTPGASGSHILQAWDTRNPATPQLIGSQTIESNSSAGNARLYLHPNGRQAVVDIPQRRVVALDLRPAYEFLEGVQQQNLFFEVNTFSEGGNLFLRDLGFTPDGAQLFWAEQGDTMPAMYDFVTQLDKDITLISGGDQVGVAGQALPAPVRVRLTDQATGEAIPNGIVEVRVLQGLGTLEGGETVRIQATDTAGFLEVRNWALGSDLASPTNVIRILAAGARAQIQVTATAQADPASVPLSPSEILPFNGASGLGVTTVAQVVFNKAIARSTIDASSVFLRNAGTGTPVASKIGFAENDRRVSLLPEASLEYGTIYEIVIEGTVADVSGATLGATSVTSFTTETPPVPALTAVNPPAGPVGAEVILSGSGFDPVFANNQIFLGTKPITPLAGTTDFLRFVVPSGAASGAVRVDVGSLSTGTQNFSVLVPVTTPIDEVGASIDLGLTTQALAVAPDGTRGYAVSRETDELLPIDLTTLGELPPIGVGDQPVAVVVDASGTYAYTANYGDGTVSVVEVATNTLVQSVNVGGNPTELVADPLGDRIFVVQPGSQLVTVIDTDPTSATFHGAVAALATGKSTKGSTISPDGTTLYLGTNTGFLAVDIGPTDFGAVAALATGKSTKGASISPDGSLLVLVTTDGTVLVIDVSPTGNNAAVASLATGQSTKGASISPDGSLLYLLQEDSDEILVYAIEVIGSVSVVQGTLLPLTVVLTEITSIDAGDDPAWIAFDPRGNGTVFVGASGDQVINVLAEVIPGTCLTATVRIESRIPKLPDRYVLAAIELPKNFDVKDIDVTTIRLAGSVPIWSAYPPRIGDDDQDLVEEVIVAFDRCAFQDVVAEGDSVEVCVTGRLVTGECFTGCDLVDTWRPTLLFPTSDSVLEATQLVTVRWETPAGVNADAVGVYWSADGGRNYFAIAENIPDTGSVDWVVPDVFTEAGHIMVVYFRNKVVVGAGMNCEPFTMLSIAVPVLMQNVELRSQDGDGVIEWSVARVTGLTGFRVMRSVQDGAWQEVGNLAATSARKAAGNLEFDFVDQEVQARTQYRYLLVETRNDSQDGYSHGPYELEFEVENRLDQNVPNSFNPKTNIRFSIAQAGRVKLVVYDVRGRRVNTLVDAELASDVYTLTWDGTDDRGGQVSSGIYFYRLQTESFAASRKMTLVR